MPVATVIVKTPIEFIELYMQHSNSHAEQFAQLCEKWSNHTFLGISSLSICTEHARGERYIIYMSAQALARLAKVMQANCLIICHHFMYKHWFI